MLCSSPSFKGKGCYSHLLDGQISLPVTLTKAEYFQPYFSVMLAYKPEDVVYYPKGGNSEKQRPLLDSKYFSI